MSKELSTLDKAVIETADPTVELFELDDLTLAMIGGGEAVVAV